MVDFQDELTANAEDQQDPERHLVRGGSARLWPWVTGEDAWVWLMSAARRPWREEGAPRDVTLRLALSL